MKKKLLIILGIIVLVILIVLLSIFIINKDKPVPFVKKYDIDITSAKKKYSNPAYSYSKDADTGELLYTDKINFKDTKSTYKFTNLKKDNSTVLDKYTFNIEIETPIEYTSTYTEKAWTYTFSSVDPILFDYYTGEVYRVGTDVLNNSLEGININKDNSNMKYTTINWDNKSYQIGILKQYDAKWVGKKVDIDKNNNRKYSDINIGTSSYKIEVPKDYDGLMIAILKRESDKESFEKNIDRYQKYNRLYDEYEKTGTKSDELKQLEKENDQVISLFDSLIDKDLKYNKDDYYVIRLNKIPKAK